MSQRTLAMPRLGETMEEGTITAWLVAPGGAFRRGEPILEVETDKTVVEYPALGDGVMVEPLAREGEVVRVGAPVARVEVADPADWQDAGDGTGAVGDPEPPAPRPEAQATAPVVAGTGSDAAPARPRATPLARRLARQAGIDIATLGGTGRRGRIEARDVEAAAPGPAVTAESLLLIHGFAGDGTAWAAAEAALKRAGRTVLSPDLPGHGENPVPAGSPDDLVAAAVAAARGMPGRLHLVGHSLGAWVAVQAALVLGARVTRLTLIAPAGAGREIDAGFVHAMAGVTTEGELAHLLRLLGPRAAALSAEATAAMARQLAAGRLRALAAAVAGPSGAQRLDILRPLAALPAGVTVRALFGIDDRILPVAQAMNMPPRVAVHFLPAGHMPQWDAPADVARLLLGGGGDA